MDGNGSNNAHGNEAKHYTELVLTLDVFPTWHLNIGGNIENDDVALAVLQHAVRYFEQRQRAAALLDIQKQLQEQARTAGLVNKVLGRG